MRKFYFLVLGLLFFSGVKAQIVNIPDVNFKAKLLTYSYSDNSGDHILNINNDGEIQVSEAQNIQILLVDNANISSLEGISSFSNLTLLSISNNNVTSLDLTSLSKLESLECATNKFTSFDKIKGIDGISYLDCSDNQFTSIDLTGLSLTYLVCSGNKLQSLDVSGLINLVSLRCTDNQLTTLDISGLEKLETLYCRNNQLNSLNSNKCMNLKDLDCAFNQLTSIDVTDNINLAAVNFSNNKLSTLDFSSNINGFNVESNAIFLRFNVSHNQLTSIIFPKFYQIEEVDLSFNLFETLELPAAKYVYTWQLNLSNNPNLTTLFLKNMKIKDEATGWNDVIDYKDIIKDCPNLKYICADDSQINSIQLAINTNGYNFCHTNSYCSFVPGGEFYISGNCKLDGNENGCDVLDSNYPNLKISISDGTNNENLITDFSGNYNINVQAGTYTITPVLENPDYFTIFPENIIVNFPTETSPFVNNFCLLPINHTDLEVTILPINRARPGFDATYKIIYKNKGTNIQSGGSVNLTFDDAVLDLVNANPIVSNQSTDKLSWNYLDLKPFETKEIEVTFNVNSPIETPAVNIDDSLSFNALINPIAGDEQPVDNSFALRQLVVGSFDPNDKTCLEGATIEPSAVGKYVHYVIRFENKGTAEAQNIVVKDMIDTDKFDISSLVITQGSHPFVTRITETNKVEFIFENINLPFDDATNDGYVAFKIKTNPSLVVGDSFSNTASIYFDYNFPIVTNTATTSVLQSLGTNDFEFDSYFKVYPSPAKEVLNIDVKKQINVSSINIYNTLGQQILVIPNSQYTKQVDVSHLKTGNYFIKLNSDKGSTVGKFIKAN